MWFEAILEPVPITTKVVSSMARCTLYNIMWQFVSDLRQVGGFLWVLWIPLPIKLTTKILLIDWFLVFIATLKQYFIYIIVTSFSGGRNRTTRREPPTMGKPLVNFITCSCESSAPFFKFTKPGANPRRIGDMLVWVVR